MQRVSIDDNQHVVEGQILVILDPNEYEVRLDQAQAALDAAGRQVQTPAAAINTASRSATAQTTQAQGAIGEAKASIQTSKATVIAAAAGVPRAERAGFQTNPRPPARQLSDRSSRAGRSKGGGKTGTGAADCGTAKRCTG